jgi:hypothetical protein
VTRKTILFKLPDQAIARELRQPRTGADEWVGEAAFARPDAHVRERRAEGSGPGEHQPPSADVLGRALQEFPREWMRLAREAVERNTADAARLMRCRTPQDVLAWQARCASETLEQALLATSRVALLSARISGEAAQVVAARGRP